MSINPDLRVFESTHVADMVPDARVAVARFTERGATTYEVHAACVYNDNTAKLDQYRHPGMDRLMELFPDDVTAEHTDALLLQRGFAFVRTAVREAIAKAVANAEDRARLYAEVASEKWLVATVDSAAFSLSILPTEILRKIYDKSADGILSTAADHAASIREHLADLNAHYRDM